MKRTISLGLAACLCILTAAGLGAQQALAVGGRGPAGGLIFYDRGRGSEGWRYLEAAPEDLPGIQWYNGDSGGTGAKDEGVGSGRANTASIIRAYGPGDYAALACARCSQGGVQDWFLPSEDELRLMLDNLCRKGLGGFAASYYWSSTQRDASSAEGINFSLVARKDLGLKGGDYMVLSQDLIPRVRPVRQVADGGGPSASPVAVSLPAPPARPAPVVKEAYAVGETGPAGGTVFFDKGSREGGWRYLEAAPEDLAESWWSDGPYVSTGARGTAVGTGRANSAKIVKARAAAKNAAAACAAYSASGAKDWFLPSRDELELMFRNLYQKGLGGFAGSGYWSSSEDPENPSSMALYHGFLSGHQFGDDKNMGYHLIRPIRAF